MKTYSINPTLKLILSENSLNGFIEFDGRTFPLGDIAEFETKLGEILSGNYESDEDKEGNEFTELDNYENEMESRGLERYKGYD